MIKFISPDPSIVSELKKEVNSYFEENKISKRGNWKLYLKTFFWLSSLALLYTILVFFTPSNFISFILCIALGCVFAGIGFNIGHDAAHGAYSKKGWVNELFSRGFDLLGASSDIWKRKHNVSHHSFPNIDHEDDDINVSPLLRLNKNQKWYWWYRLQIVYMWFLYALEYIGWVLFFDYTKYFKRKVANTPIHMSVSQHIFFWVNKLAYYTIFLVIPINVVGLSHALYGFIIAGVTCGLALSIVFQMAHVQEKVQFPVPVIIEGEKNPIVEEDNSIHQMKTTADFATKSATLSWLFGGLNFQVIHHLFRDISHVHYPALQKIVVSWAQRHGIDYKSYSTFLSVFISHVRHMWNMSKKPSLN